MDVLHVTGSIVIVTGASSGIGAATARLLHEAGAHPVLAARRADRLAELSEELDGALAVPTDVTDPIAVRRLAETTLDRHGRIDGLVNKRRREPAHAPRPARSRRVRPRAPAQRHQPRGHDPGRAASYARPALGSNRQHQLRHDPDLSLIHI